MSCRMTEAEELAKISTYVAAILEASERSGLVTGVKRIHPPEGLAQALEDCRDRESGVWDAKGVFTRLYVLNERAYASRYSDYGYKPGESVPPIPDVIVDVGDNGFREWVTRLYNLLSFYCYQTAEDDTMNDPLRLAMEGLCDELAHVIARLVVDDYGVQWGVW